MNAPGSILLAAFGNGHVNGDWSVQAIVANPVELLKARYARGELTTEEFEQHLRTMNDRTS